MSLDSTKTIVCVGFVSALVISACMPPPPAPTASSGASGDIQVAQASGGMAGVLARHNQLRAQHCVPALAWSEQLARTAQAWANRCVFQHSDNDLGENLAAGTSGAFTAESFVDDWYSEISSYDFASGQSTDGEAVGHFTQVVWASTQQVGCGIARCGGEDIFVCNYSPPGNYVGEEVANVPPRCQ